MSNILKRNKNMIRYDSKNNLKNHSGRSEQKSPVIFEANKTSSEIIQYEK